MAGCVYFIESWPFVKIGFTTQSPTDRFRGIRNDEKNRPPGCDPGLMTIAGWMPADLRHEKELHSIFRPYAVEGLREWYLGNSFIGALGPAMREVSAKSTLPGMADFVVSFARSVVALDQSSVEKLRAYQPREYSAQDAMNTLAARKEEARERTIAGLETARQSGKTLGHPRVAYDLSYLKRLRSDGLSIRQIAEKTGMKSATVHRAMMAAAAA